MATIMLDMEVDAEKLAQILAEVRASCSNLMDVFATADALKLAVDLRMQDILSAYFIVFGDRRYALDDICSR